MSGRSDARGLTFGQLPQGGFQGEVPVFPLPRMLRYVWVYEEKSRLREVSEELTDAFRDREIAVWEEAWTTPQADAWSRDSWRWPIVAEYCRLKTVVETEPDANASLVGQLHRFRDQLGLTPAGMKENGWTIAVPAAAAPTVASDGSVAPVRRLRAVGG
jgi:hypothetical protein